VVGVLARKQNVANRKYENMFADRIMKSLALSLSEILICL
jgi:hypothetical protein